MTCPKCGEQMTFIAEYPWKFDSVVYVYQCPKCQTKDTLTVQKKEE